MIDIIPEKVLSYLPFSSEPLSQWNEATDLLKFLYTLHDKSGTIIAQNGTRTPVNYREYGKVVYERGQKELESWIQQFTTTAGKARPAPASITQKVEVPNFAYDPAFGKAAKYFIAWDGVVGETLSESAFFSIEHVIESEDDLECSLYLAAGLYYKQALQVLRNFIEDLVLPIHFCGNPSEFSAWKSNEYRTPQLRGNNGVLNKLVERRILSAEEATETANLYGDLSACTHGAEKRLLNRGIYAGRWAGHVFQYSDFLEWAKYFSESVNLGIYLLRLNINQWRTLRPVGKRFCDVCHNSEDFDIEKYEFAKEPHVKYRCLKCGHEMTFSDSST